MLSLTFMCLLLAFRSISSGDLEEGDQCSFNNTSRGICKVITDCPVVLDSIKHGVFPEIHCGFAGKQPIVCCKESTSIPAPTPKSTAIPTSKPAPKPTPQPATATPVNVTNRAPGDISKQKCKEYAQYAYEKIEPPTLSVLNHNFYSLKCPYGKANSIEQSVLAIPHEFPHMALIGYATNEGTEWACGGSLISENYILTAASCLENRLGPAKYVRLGITYQTNTTYLQERVVSGLIPHPEYRRPSKYHDIGLLRLEKNPDLNPYVRPACIQTEKRIPSERAIASGWEKTEYSEADSIYLVRIVLKFFDLPKCNATYKRDINAPDSVIKDGIIDDLMICAGSTTCTGNPGGLLQIYHENTPEIKCMYDILGILSFTKGCGFVINIPSVYTRVSQYIKWIEDHVWP